MADPPRLTILFNPTNRVVSLRVLGESGTYYVIEASGDLKHWTPLRSGPAKDGQLDFQFMPGASNQATFYRARQAWPPRKVVL